jgi:phosphate transport system permease protein
MNNTLSLTQTPKKLRQRLKGERRFRIMALVSLAIPSSFLFFLLTYIMYHAWPAFFHTYISLATTTTDIAPLAGNDGTGPDYRVMIRQLLEKNLAINPTSSERRELMKLLSPHAADELRDLQPPIGQPSSFFIDVRTSSLVDDYQTSGPKDSKLSDNQRQWVEQLEQQQQIKTSLDTLFWSKGDSREPEEAGILGSITGTFLTMIITLLLSLPFGAAAALYLEEFSKKNFLSRCIEININNLAAIPSIIFGLLGIVVFLGFFDLPRSSPLVGGMVLALMTLPVIIIATRAALRSVPDSVRQAALAVGASPAQVVWHHVFPLALPGVLTGTILGMARALGETAPLMMVGMIAFVVDIPAKFTDPATVLPAQIYMWSDLQETAFVEKTYAAIFVLLLFLVLMNLVAIIIRQRVEKKW